MKRRSFLQRGAGAIAGLAGLARGRVLTAAEQPQDGTVMNARTPVTLFLCGDVMTGRGIDQILPHPSNPILHESYVRSAKDYVALAERANGRIEKPVGFDYIWGDALDELNRRKPNARIVNLETAITTSDAAWPGKGIHYRMHPRNIGCLTAAKLDCCVLANNHVLDWSHSGLIETLETLRAARIQSAGAGLHESLARQPARIALANERRVLVFAYGSPSSGVSEVWAASKDQPGVNVLRTLSEETVEAIAASVQAEKRAGDIAIASVHWGGNWGYGVAHRERNFARALIDQAGVDVVHGHSSHHPKEIEIHRNKLILYGCGDFINDYEGIGGYENFRAELSLMYFPTLDSASGQLTDLILVPTCMRRMRVNRAARQDAEWLADMLHRESRQHGLRFELTADNTLAARWG